MATNDRSTPRHAAKHAAKPTASSTRSSRQSTRRSGTPDSERVRISDRTNVDRQVSASRASGTRSMASELRLSGANRPSYGRRASDTKPGKGPLVVVAIAALAVLLVLFFLIRGCVTSTIQQIDSEPEAEPQQVQTTADDSVTFQGVTFSIDTGTSPAQVVFEEPDGGSSGTLFELEGTPVALILFDGTIVVPENLGGTWHVMAYTLGNDSLPTPVIGPDGNPVTGMGDIVEATLEGSVVRVTDSTGTTTDVSLV